MGHLRCEVTLHLVDDAHAGTGQIWAGWRIGNEAFDAQPTIRLSELSFIRSLRTRALEAALTPSSSDARVVHDTKRITRLEAQCVALGSQIFLALVPSEVVQSRLASVIKRAELVCIGIRTSHPQLEEVPWELVRDPELKWLALCEGVSIVRLGDPSLPSLEVGTPRRIKVFYVDAGAVAQGDGLPVLAKERWPSHRALSPAVTDAAPNLDHVSWFAVEEAMAADTTGVNVFHFTGHGNQPTPDTEASLVFSGRERLDNVGVDRVGPVLADAGIRLAMLPACHAGIDASWRGLGAGLLRWVPAVVSMQGAVIDSVADTFAEEVYLQLGLGENLDNAVAAARRRLADQDSAFIDWWLPVLHTSASEPIRFAKHPDVTARMGSAAASVPARRSYSVNGQVAPVGVEGEALWFPPEGVHPSEGGRLHLSANGSYYVVAWSSGDVVIGRRSGEDVEWWRQLSVGRGMVARAIEVNEQSVIVIASSSIGTREVYIHGCRLRAGEVWPEPAATAAWTGSGFTCLDDLGRPFGAEHARPLPLQRAHHLDAAIGAGERLAAWVEDRHLVVCRTDLAEGAEERRRLVLDELPTEVLVSRSGPDRRPRAVFVRVRSDLRGWLWDDLRTE